MASYPIQHRRLRVEINRMSKDEVDYERCGESDITEIVNSVNTTNEDVPITTVCDESSCDKNDSFVNFDNISEAGNVDDSSSDEQFDVEESISSNNDTLFEFALWYPKNNISRVALSNLLAVLRKYGNFLPKDSRAFFEDPK